MELLIGIFILVVFLILSVIMFLLGYKNALRYKVDDPIKIEELLSGEGWDNEVYLAYEELTDILHRDLNDEEKKFFMILVEEGFRKKKTLISKFLERYQPKGDGHH